MGSISTRMVYMVRAKYQFNWKSSEKCKVITLVWIFKVIASKENNAPTALRGHTNRQVFINKDRKTTPRELICAQNKMLSQLKIIISIYSLPGTSLTHQLLHFSVAASERKKRDCKLPSFAAQLAILSMGCRENGIDQLTRLLHRCAGEPSQKTPESR